MIGVKWSLSRILLNIDALCRLDGNTKLGRRARERQRRDESEKTCCVNTKSINIGNQSCRLGGRFASKGASEPFTTDPRRERIKDVWICVSFDKMTLPARIKTPQQRRIAPRMPRPRCCCLAAASSLKCSSQLPLRFATGMEGSGEEWEEVWRGGAALKEDTFWLRAQLVHVGPIHPDALPASTAGSLPSKHDGSPMNTNQQLRFQSPYNCAKTTNRIK